MSCPRSPPAVAAPRHRAHRLTAESPRPGSSAVMWFAVSVGPRRPGTRSDCPGRGVACQPDDRARSRRPDRRPHAGSRRPRASGPEQQEARTDGRTDGTRPAAGRAPAERTAPPGHDGLGGLGDLEGEPVQVLPGEPVAVGRVDVLTRTPVDERAGEDEPPGLDADRDLSRLATDEPLQVSSPPPVCSRRQPAPRTRTTSGQPAEQVGQRLLVRGRITLAPPGEPTRTGRPTRVPARLNRQPPSATSPRSASSNHSGEGIPHTIGTDPGRPVTAEPEAGSGHRQEAERHLPGSPDRADGARQVTGGGGR